MVEYDFFSCTFSEFNFLFFSVEKNNDRVVVLVSDVVSWLKEFEFIFDWCGCRIAWREFEAVKEWEKI